MRKKQLAFVVELDRCIGCKGCQVACKMENGTPLGSDRIKVRKVGPTGTYPNLEMYFLPTMCQQCEEPVCARVCPTGAIYKNESDGVVKIDREKCIGCHSCNNACPYHANTFSEARNNMDKCTICFQERANGEEPACVKNCSGKALHYGDVNDPDSEVSRLLAEAGEDHVFQFQDFGNHPSARYILKHAAWQDILPQELDVVSFGKGGKKYYE
ncbi:MAG: 4Fe-4S dicluster domain-containing protein [Lachnospiraceae bacterium]|jgi:Fe-S-cluster-containing dehydrogenase component|uniref:4Fe-4S dicluster domain-containing protein n=1 Tax=Clostridium sp. (strain SY8519) TaxID=1042156 RepID=UPI000217164C|nr:4Fe-4S dicluster domain-containing protein [Clostridium sp. SY8519]MCI1654968.1 4Fe-4S dicluster domain-containing protein [Lachnospiraceae bacterium]MCI1657330.1 4Fe-4S dicluster domain-containing protein [Lachnospiraceae bacterium]MCI2195808.1 4Fe-4S dicluster domain-containing protein [Lachnospiraceae bacterium]BAK46017.1 Fe-S-cluster-containing hydrogenase component 1 [Clostridium sp. SY8519]HAD19130.1 4Fe-4S dicluster domain-containing protein [Lachnospiraceae bacterium]